MTKMRFEAAARMIRTTSYDDDHRKELVINFCVELFRQFNGCYDANRFRRACE